MRVLVRRSPEAPLSGYIEEILAVEGFLGCDTVDLTGRELTRDLLEGQDLVIVAHMPLETTEQEALSGYVRGGGRLIALRPPVEMASLFGLEARGRLLTRGHSLQFDATGCPAGARSTETPLQVHADADCYEAKGAEVAAWFCWGTGARRNFPATALHREGDGWAAMLAFDLARSTVLFHQGLPEQASTGSRPDPGALAQYKPDGHFVGHLDVARVTLPQADLQQRLIGALVDRMLPAPVPRLWYFPDGEPCLAFLNGDSDNMTLADLEAVLAILEPHGGQYTCYVMDEQPLAPQAEEEQIAGFRRRYGYTPLTNRGHCLIWTGWTEMARFLASAGVRMDANFVGCHCGHGYLTGSGLPVKFMDARGQRIDLYEQSTQWEDDVALGAYFEQLSYDPAVTASLETLQDARERFHTVVNFNFHPIHTRKNRLNTVPWITAVAEFCCEHRIPMIGGDDWVRFNEARRRVTMSGYAADRASRRVRFTLTAAEPVAGLTVTLPGTWDEAPITGATAEGTPLSLRRTRVHDADRAFARLTLRAGEECVVEVAYLV
jgi:hypothetical protein